MAKVKVKTRKQKKPKSGPKSKRIRKNAHIARVLPESPCVPAAGVWLPPLPENEKI